MKIKTLNEIAEYLKRKISTHKDCSCCFISPCVQHGRMLLQYLQHIMGTKYTHITRKIGNRLEFSNGSVVEAMSDRGHGHSLRGVRFDIIILFDITNLSDEIIDSAYMVKIANGPDTTIVEVL